MTKPNTFTLIRERHHTLARLLASGLSAQEVAHLTATSEAQLNRQCLDPAFRDLIARYRNVEIASNANERFQYLAAA